MLKGMFVNCWGCHLTTKLDDRTQDWCKLDVIDKGEIICNADFCSRAHLDSWLKNDLVPLLVQEIFDEATDETPRPITSNYGFISGAAYSSVFSGSISFPHTTPKIGKCITCGKDGPFRLELVIYHNKTVEPKCFCSLDCLKVEKIVES